ncbi:RHS repeat-associated protein [Xanthomonas sacchari]|uniref:RHS repeat-associated core domain-containing protein n=1 Tax=Xanthomonas sacchari TaxID=56458 RepID=UPI002786487B|nr:RHS repeat-associated core domain-containing protein [Xanthomonas sacchari]MDQ1091082.1 RHS repeat-associated protein [Xanthomonas sacchari]
MSNFQGIRAALRLMAAAGLSLLVAFGASAQTVHYIHTDGLGSVVLVTDKDRNSIERSEYEPYGDLLNHPLTEAPAYAGHVMDAATGLTYMQQRYYDQGIGRFLSVDPIDSSSMSTDKFNRYLYANNNPYRYNDPDGRDSCDVCNGLAAQARSAAINYAAKKAVDLGRGAVEGAKNVVKQEIKSLKDLLRERDVVVSLGGAGMIGSPLVGNSVTSPGVTLVGDLGVVANLTHPQIGFQFNLGGIPSIGGGGVASLNASVGLNDGPLTTGISQTNIAFAQISAVPETGTPIDVGFAAQWSGSGKSASFGLKPGVGSYIGAGSGTMITGTLITPSPQRLRKEGK